jgi:hypothetical protein
MKRVVYLAVLAFFSVSSVAAAQSGFRNARIFEFDPGASDLIQAEWMPGIGCATTATINTLDSSGNLVPSQYNDPGCPTGAPGDFRKQGLLVAKTGPSANHASAGVDLKGAEGETMTALGYDIRKSGGPASPYGSHCGAGAPRFNVVTDFGTHFIGCASPGVVASSSSGWTRLRWTPEQAFPPIPPTAPMRSLSIVLDEGQDVGPDYFGLAVLDNVYVNGVMIGKAILAGGGGA